MRASDYCSYQSFIAVFICMLIVLSPVAYSVDQCIQKEGVAAGIATNNQIVVGLIHDISQLAPEATNAQIRALITNELGATALTYIDGVNRENKIQQLIDGYNLEESRKRDVGNILKAIDPIELFRNDFSFDTLKANDPAHVESDPMFDIEAEFKPKEAVSGDDLSVRSRENIVEVQQADAQNHGVRAAILRRLLASARQRAGEITDVEDYTKRLQELLVDAGMYRQSFITYNLLLIDKKSGKMTVVNAGGNPVYILSKSGIQKINPSGTVLRPDFADLFRSSLGSATEDVYNGETIFSYSDGVTDAQNSKSETLDLVGLSEWDAGVENSQGEMILRTYDPNAKSKTGKLGVYSFAVFKSGKQVFSSSSAMDALMYFNREKLPADLKKEVNRVKDAFRGITEDSDDVSFVALRYKGETGERIATIEAPIETGEEFNIPMEETEPSQDVNDFDKKANYVLAQKQPGYAEVSMLLDEVDKLRQSLDSQGKLTNKDVVTLSTLKSRLSLAETYVTLNLPNSKGVLENVALRAERMQAEGRSSGEREYLDSTVETRINSILSGAQQEANAMLATKAPLAKQEADKLLAEAQKKADEIRRKAELFRPYTYLLKLTDTRPGKQKIYVAKLANSGGYADLINGDRLSNFNNHQSSLFSANFLATMASDSNLGLKNLRTVPTSVIPIYDGHLILSDYALGAEAIRDRSVFDREKELQDSRLELKPEAVDAYNSLFNSMDDASRQDARSIAVVEALLEMTDTETFYNTFNNLVVGIDTEMSLMPLRNVINKPFFRESRLEFPQIDHAETPQQIDGIYAKYYAEAVKKVRDFVNSPEGKAKISELAAKSGYNSEQLYSHMQQRAAQLEQMMRGLIAERTLLYDKNAKEWVTPTEFEKRSKQQAQKPQQAPAAAQQPQQAPAAVQPQQTPVSVSADTAVLDKEGAVAFQEQPDSGVNPNQLSPDLKEAVRTDLYEGVAATRADLIRAADLHPDKAENLRALASEKGIIEVDGKLYKRYGGSSENPNLLPIVLQSDGTVLIGKAYDPQRYAAEYFGSELHRLFGYKVPAVKKGIIDGKNYILSEYIFGARPSTSEEIRKQIPGSVLATIMSNPRDDILTNPQLDPESAVFVYDRNIGNYITDQEGNVWIIDFEGAKSPSARKNNLVGQVKELMARGLLQPGDSTLMVREVRKLDATKLSELFKIYEKLLASEGFNQQQIDQELKTRKAGIRDAVSTVIGKMTSASNTLSTYYNILDAISRKLEPITDAEIASGVAEIVAERLTSGIDTVQGFGQAATTEIFALLDKKGISSAEQVKIYTELKNLIISREGPVAERSVLAERIVPHLDNLIDTLEGKKPAAPQPAEVAQASPLERALAAASEIVSNGELNRDAAYKILEGEGLGEGPVQPKLTEEQQIDHTVGVRDLVGGLQRKGINLGWKRTGWWEFEYNPQQLLSPFSESGRFYINANSPESATIILERLFLSLNGKVKRFAAKTSRDNYGRTDNTVAYITNPDDYEIVKNALSEIQKQNPELFNPNTPLLAQPIADGIAYATAIPKDSRTVLGEQIPEKPGSAFPLLKFSFNSLHSYVLEKTVKEAVKRGLMDANGKTLPGKDKELLDLYKQALRDAGFNPEQPYQLLPSSRQNQRGSTLVELPIFLGLGAVSLMLSPFIAPLAVAGLSLMQISRIRTQARDAGVEIGFFDSSTVLDLWRRSSSSGKLVAQILEEDRLARVAAAEASAMNARDSPEIEEAIVNSVIEKLAGKVTVADAERYVSLVKMFTMSYSQADMETLKAISSAVSSSAKEQKLNLMTQNHMVSERIAQLLADKLSSIEAQKQAAEQEAVRASQPAVPVVPAETKTGFGLKAADEKTTLEEWRNNQFNFWVPRASDIEKMYVQAQAVSSNKASVPVFVSMGAGSGTVEYLLAKRGAEVVAVDPDMAQIQGAIDKYGLQPHETIPGVWVHPTLKFTFILGDSANFKPALKALGINTIEYSQEIKTLQNEIDADRQSFVSEMQPLEQEMSNLETQLNEMDKEANPALYQETYANYKEVKKQMKQKIDSIYTPLEAKRKKLETAMADFNRKYATQQEITGKYVDAFIGSWMYIDYDYLLYNHGAKLIYYMEESGGATGVQSFESTKSIYPFDSNDPEDIRLSYPNLVVLNRGILQPSYQNTQLSSKADEWEGLLWTAVSGRPVRDYNLFEVFARDNSVAYRLRKAEDIPNPRQIYAWEQQEIDEEKARQSGDLAVLPKVNDPVIVMYNGAPTQFIVDGFNKDRSKILIYSSKLSQSLTLTVDEYKQSAKEARSLIEQQDQQKPAMAKQSAQLPSLSASRAKEIAGILHGLYTRVDTKEGPNINIYANPRASTQEIADKLGISQADVLDFIMFHEMFHSYVNQIGLSIDLETEEMLADIFARKMIGQEISPQDEVLFQQKVGATPEEAAKSLSQKFVITPMSPEGMDQAAVAAAFKESAVVRMMSEDLGRTVPSSSERVTPNQGFFSSLQNKLIAAGIAASLIIGGVFGVPALTKQYNGYKAQFAVTATEKEISGLVQTITIAKETVKENEYLLTEAELESLNKVIADSESKLNQLNGQLGDAKNIIQRQGYLEVRTGFEEGYAASQGKAMQVPSQIAKSVASELKSKVIDYANAKKNLRDTVVSNEWYLKARLKKPLQPNLAERPEELSDVPDKFYKQIPVTSSQLEYEMRQLGVLEAEAAPAEIEEKPLGEGINPDLYNSLGANLVSHKKILDSIISDFGKINPVAQEKASSMYAKAFAAYSKVRALNDKLTWYRAKQLDKSITPEQLKALQAEQNKVIALINEGDSSLRELESYNAVLRDQWYEYVSKLDSEKKSFSHSKTSISVDSKGNVHTSVDFYDSDGLKFFYILTRVGRDGKSTSKRIDVGEKDSEVTSDWKTWPYKANEQKDYVQDYKPYGFDNTQKKQGMMDVIKPEIVKETPAAPSTPATKPSAEVPTAEDLEQASLEVESTEKTFLEANNLRQTCTDCIDLIVQVRALIDQRNFAGANQLLDEHINGNAVVIKIQQGAVAVAEEDYDKALTDCIPGAINALAPYIAVQNPGAEAVQQRLLRLSAMIKAKVAAGSAAAAQTTPSTPAKTATPEEIAKLVNDLQSGDGFTTNAAMEALAEIGQQAAPAVKKALDSTIVRNKQDTKNQILRSIYADTLYRMNAYQDSVPALRELLKSPDGITVRDALIALGNLGPSAKDAGQDLIDLLGRAGKYYETEISDVLVKIGPSAVILLVGKLERDRFNPGLQQFASDALAKFGKEAIPALIDALQDPNKDAFASQALIKLDKDALPYLTDAIKNPDFSAKLSVVDIIDKIGSNGNYVVLSIADALSSDDIGAAIYAADVLGKMDEPAKDAVPALVKALQSTDYDLADSAAHALGLIGEQPEIAVPGLAAALKSPDPDVRRTAAKSLGLIAELPDITLPALIEALKDKDSRVVANAAWSLSIFGKSAIDNRYAKIVVPPLLEAAKRINLDANARAYCFGAIAQISEDAKYVDPALLELFDYSKDPVEDPRKLTPAQWAEGEAIYQLRTDALNTFIRSSYKFVAVTLMLMKKSDDKYISNLINQYAKNENLNSEQTSKLLSRDENGQLSIIAKADLFDSHGLGAYVGDILRYPDATDMIIRSANFRKLLDEGISGFEELKNAEGRTIANTIPTILTIVQLMTPSQRDVVANLFDGKDYKGDPLTDAYGKPMSLMTLPAADIPNFIRSYPSYPEATLVALEYGQLSPVLIADIDKALQINQEKTIAGMIGFKITADNTDQFYTYHLSGKELIDFASGKVTEQSILARERARLRRNEEIRKILLDKKVLDSVLDPMLKEVLREANERGLVLSLLSGSSRNPIAKYMLDGRITNLEQRTAVHDVDARVKEIKISSSDLEKCGAPCSAESVSLLSGIVGNGMWLPAFEPSIEGKVQRFDGAAMSQLRIKRYRDLLESPLGKAIPQLSSLFNTDGTINEAEFELRLSNPKNPTTEQALLDNIISTIQSLTGARIKSIPSVQNLGMRFDVRGDHSAVTRGDTNINAIEIVGTKDGSYDILDPELGLIDFEQGKVHISTGSQSVQGKYHPINNLVRNTEEVALATLLRLFRHNIQFGLKFDPEELRQTEYALDTIVVRGRISGILADKVEQNAEKLFDFLEQADLTSEETSLIINRLATVYPQYSEVLGRMVSALKQNPETYALNNMLYSLMTPEQRQAFLRGEKISFSDIAFHASPRKEGESKIGIAEVPLQMIIESKGLKPGDRQMQTPPTAQFGVYFTIRADEALSYSGSTGMLFAYDRQTLETLINGGEIQGEPVQPHSAYGAFFRKDTENYILSLEKGKQSILPLKYARAVYLSSEQLALARIKWDNLLADARLSILNDNSIPKEQKAEKIRQKINEIKLSTLGKNSDGTVREFDDVFSSFYTTSLIKPTAENVLVLLTNAVANSDNPAIEEYTRAADTLLGKSAETNEKVRQAADKGQKLKEEIANAKLREAAEVNGGVVSQAAAQAAQATPQAQAQTSGLTPAPVVTHGEQAAPAENANKQPGIFTRAWNYVSGFFSGIVKVRSEAEAAGVDIGFFDFIRQARIVSNRLAGDTLQNALIKDSLITSSLSYSKYERGNAESYILNQGASAIPALIESLSNKDPVIRAHAGDFLTKIGPAAVTALSEATKDPDIRVNQEAASALGKIGPASVLSFIELLKNKDPRVRSTAAAQLGRIGKTASAAVFVLIEAIKDTDSLTRRNSVYALGSIGPDAKPAIPALIEVLRGTDSNLKKEAVTSLESIKPGLGKSLAKIRFTDVSAKVIGNFLTNTDLVKLSPYRLYLYFSRITDKAEALSKLKSNVLIQELSKIISQADNDFLEFGSQSYYGEKVKDYSLYESVLSSPEFSGDDFEADIADLAEKALKVDIKGKTMPEILKEMDDKVSTLPIKTPSVKSFDLTTKQVEMVLPQDIEDKLRASIQSVLETTSEVSTEDVQKKIQEIETAVDASDTAPEEFKKMMAKYQVPDSLVKKINEPKIKANIKNFIYKKLDISTEEIDALLRTVFEKMDSDSGGLLRRFANGEELSADDKNKLFIKLSESDRIASDEMIRLKLPQLTIKLQDTDQFRALIPVKDAVIRTSGESESAKKTIQLVFKPKNLLSLFQGQYAGTCMGDYPYDNAREDLLPVNILKDGKLAGAILFNIQGGKLVMIGFDPSESLASSMDADKTHELIDNIMAKVYEFARENNLQLLVTNKAGGLSNRRGYEKYIFSNYLTDVSVGLETRQYQPDHPEYVVTSGYQVKPQEETPAEKLAAPAAVSEAQSSATSPQSTAPFGVTEQKTGKSFISKSTPKPLRASVLVEESYHGALRLRKTLAAAIDTMMGAEGIADEISRLKKENPFYASMDDRTIAEEIFVKYITALTLKDRLDTAPEELKSRRNAFYSINDLSYRNIVVRALGLSESAADAEILSKSKELMGFQKTDAVFTLSERKDSAIISQIFENGGVASAAQLEISLISARLADRTMSQLEILDLIKRIKLADTEEKYRPLKFDMVSTKELRDLLNAMQGFEETLDIMKAYRMYYLYSKLNPAKAEELRKKIVAGAIKINSLADFEAAFQGLEQNAALPQAALPDTAGEAKEKISFINENGKFDEGWEIESINGDEITITKAGRTERITKEKTYTALELRKGEPLDRLIEMMKKYSSLNVIAFEENGEVVLRFGEPAVLHADMAKPGIPYIPGDSMTGLADVLLELNYLGEPVIKDIAEDASNSELYQRLLDYTNPLLQQAAEGAQIFTLENEQLSFMVLDPAGIVWHYKQEGDKVYIYKKGAKLGLFKDGNIEPYYIDLKESNHGAIANSVNEWIAKNPDFGAPKINYGTATDLLILIEGELNGQKVIKPQFANEDEYLQFAYSNRKLAKSLLDLAGDTPIVPKYSQIGGDVAPFKKIGLVGKNVAKLGEYGSDYKASLGGKAANLGDMIKLGLPVPRGFVLTTEAFDAYNSGPNAELPEQEIVSMLSGTFTDKTLGDSKQPLFVSVRSGAAISMPGMMDTVLNVGLTSQTYDILKQRIGPEAAARTYIQFLYSFGTNVLGIKNSEFIQALDYLEITHTGDKEEGRLNFGLAAIKNINLLNPILEEFRAVYENNQYPERKQYLTDSNTQLRAAIRSVFDSWNSERAVSYRSANKIPDSMGTAVTVQEMVFGNNVGDSMSGVLFTSNPSTGENVLTGEFLNNAQGEEVVAGRGNVKSVSQLEKTNPLLYLELRDYARQLEQYYGAPQDIEFTVEQGKLYILQTRNLKMEPVAAIKAKIGLFKQGLIRNLATAEPLSEAEFMQSISALQAVASQKAVDAGESKPLLRGEAVSSGAARGYVAYNVLEAKKLIEQGKDVILVSNAITPEELGTTFRFSDGRVVPFFSLLKGIISKQGGVTSHGAIIARSFGIPAVAGIQNWDTAEQLRDSLGIPEITIDGNTGTAYEPRKVNIIEKYPGLKEAGNVAALTRILGIEKPVGPQATGQMDEYAQQVSSILDYMRQENKNLIFVMDIGATSEQSKIALDYDSAYHYQHKTENTRVEGQIVHVGEDEIMIRPRGMLDNEGNPNMDLISRFMNFIHYLETQPGFEKLEGARIYLGTPQNERFHHSSKQNQPAQQQSITGDSIYGSGTQANYAET